MLSRRGELDFYFRVEGGRDDHIPASRAFQAAYRRHPLLNLKLFTVFER